MISSISSDSYDVIQLSLCVYAFAILGLKHKTMLDFKKKYIYNIYIYIYIYSFLEEQRK